MTLIVYSAQGYDKVMTAAFSKATGIPVKLDDNPAGCHLFAATADSGPGPDPAGRQARALAAGTA